MITLKVTHELLPFFQLDEEMSKEDWMKRLNLNESQFHTLVCGHFQEVDSKIKLYDTVHRFSKNTQLIIQRQNMPLSADEIKYLKTEIQKLLDELNK